MLLNIYFQRLYRIFSGTYITFYFTFSGIYSTFIGTFAGTHITVTFTLSITFKRLYLHLLRHLHNCHHHFFYAPPTV